MQTILITGACGQVGRELLRQQRIEGIKIVATDASILDDLDADEKHRLDLSDGKAVAELCKAVKPQVIINPAAYTAVDKAESEPNVAEAVNCTAVAHLARAARSIDAAIIHYSTDYVFDGSGSHARTETAPTTPISVYGQTKLSGEKVLESELDAHLILRTSWVFSPFGVNFVKTMLRLGAERDSLKIVDDQVGAPTSARLLAAATWHLITQDLSDVRVAVRTNPGIYHLACNGETSWFGFAKEIFEMARGLGLPLRITDLASIPSSDYPTPAKRPLNSRLDCSKFARTFDFPLPSWKEELHKCLVELAAEA